MITRSATKVFEPAIKAAEALQWTHKRILYYGDKDNRKRFIESLYSAGRIDLTARNMLLDLYVEQC